MGNSTCGLELGLRIVAVISKGSQNLKDRVWGHFGHSMAWNFIFYSKMRFSSARCGSRPSRALHVLESNMHVPATRIYPIYQGTHPWAVFMYLGYIEPVLAPDPDGTHESSKKAFFINSTSKPYNELWKPKNLFQPSLIFYYVYHLPHCVLELLGELELGFVFVSLIVLWLIHRSMQVNYFVDFCYY